MKNWKKYAEKWDMPSNSTHKDVRRRMKRVAIIGRGVKRWNQAVWSRVRGRGGPGFQREWNNFYGKA